MNKKEKTPIKFRFRIDGVYYDEPPKWVKQYLGAVLSHSLFGAPKPSSIKKYKLDWENKQNYFK